MFDEETAEQLKAIHDNDYYQMVVSWMEIFGVQDNLDLQESLILEEAKEVIQVFIDHPTPSPEACVELLKEFADLNFVMFGYHAMWLRSDQTREFSEDTKQMVRTAVGVAREMMMSDELSDIMDEAFVRVVESNMSKLGPNMEVLRREDGKVLKGPLYFEPDLTDLGQTFFDLI